MRGLEHQGRRVEAMYPSAPGAPGDGLVEDCVAVITSLAARISGRRTSQRRAERIRACVEQALHREDAEDA